MSDPAVQPEPSFDDPFVDQAIRDVARLEKLADMAMDAAERISLRLRATSDMPADEAVPLLAPLTRDLALAARCVRQTLALKARIIADWRAEQAGIVEARTERRQAQKAERGAIIREEVADILEQRIERDAPKREREYLLADLRAFADDEDLDADYADRSVSELVTEVRRRIGLAPDWTRLAEKPFETDLARMEREERARDMPELIEVRREWGVAGEDDPPADAWQGDGSSP
ncbi:hypothetical protein BH11PSE2_BH11PSE2_16360 [soil metagenome]